jgi:hypothetical protein
VPVPGVWKRTLGVAAALACCSAAALAAPRTAPAAPAAETAVPSAVCAPARASPTQAARARRALLARQDLWGNELLRAPGGPSYDRARRYLPPLLYARAPGKQPLTASGVYYLALAQPEGVQGAGSVALHVADGSQILSDRVGGRSLTVWVGSAGRERYGGCVARLVPARLADGYLPIAETSYLDATGTRYRQESFAGRVPQTRALVSFVRLTVDARRARASARVRFAPSVNGLRRDGNRLVGGGATHLAFSPGATYGAGGVTYSVTRGTMRTLYVSYVNYPSPARPFAADEATYDAARRETAAYWERRLGEGASISVPEQRVQNAHRNLLIQNLGLTWRYSIGNPYEQFSFPEGVDAAQVMGEHGFGLVQRSMMRTSLTRRPTPYANWKMAQKLIGSASYYRLHRDRAYVAQTTPQLRRYVQSLGRQIRGGRGGLLERERYSSDIPDSVFGLHSQAAVWQGLREMAHVWAETGNAALAAESRMLAARLEAGLRNAVRRSQRRLPDGSLFVPARLLDDERPYDSVTQARLGSYWNLVMPYALASGLFRPGSAEATGVYRYLLRHGSRLLGIVRAGAYALYRDPVFPTGGTNQVYNINIARFLAELDEPDQLALSLYGSLAAGMTPETFVSGEAASVEPLLGRLHRAMYLPPNGASNAAFLTTLRVMLVHETRGAGGAPHGLRLAHATPRPWLEAGKRIEVRRMPTSFGPVSYTLQAEAGSVRARLDLPPRAPRSLQLRLRLPGGKRITGATLDGRPFSRFDARTGTLDLGGRSGSVELVVEVGR